MFNNILKCLVLLSPFALSPIQAFWWRSTTTEAPTTPPAMKQIPLTYFRTYTYQPMAGNPLPFPLMSSTDYITNYAALANNPYFNPMMSMMSQTATGGGGVGTGAANNEIATGPMSTGGGVRPAKSYAGINVVRSLNSGHPQATPPTTTTSTTSTTTPEPTTTTSTTTTSSSTTTSTTPAPTTTTSTTSTSTTSTESPGASNDLGLGSSAPTGPLIKADAMVNIEAAYPAFNRKVYTNHFNINYNRPVYPYPEYSVYKPMNSQASGPNEDINSGPTLNPAATGNVEFVPCMCPVNIQGGYPAGLPITGNPSNSIFLAQSRTNPEVEASLELPASDVAESANPDLMQAEEVPSVTNYVEDLQMVNMDGMDDGDDEPVTQSVVAS